jgi:O-antigen/teichoic acid export membrane protein
MVGFEFSRTRLQSDLDFGRYNGYEIARAGLTFGGVWAVCQTPVAGPGAVMALQGAVMLAVTALSLWPHLKKSQVPDVAATVQSFRELAARYPALVGYCLLLAVSTQMDVLFLKALADEPTLAGYGSALRYYQLLVMALASANTVLFPQVSRAETASELVALYRNHLKVSVFFLGVVAMAMAVAPFVMPIVDQGRYPQAVPAFLVLAVSAAISFVCAPFVNVLLRQGQFRLLLITLLVAVVVGAVLQVVLIPLWGGVGAALATLTSSAILTLQCYRVARRTLTSLKEAP